MESVNQILLLLAEGKLEFMDLPEFSLAYSPCPNDTFLFYYLTQTPLSTEFRIREHLMDVEELNHSALCGKYEITKLSFAAFFRVRDQYELLESGSAIGRNCGPILIYPKNRPPRTHLSHCKILSPGEMTTARLLLDLYLQSLNLKTDSLEIQNLRYDKIIPALERGEGDLGLVIHEERFTYRSRGMESFVDLGEWWERETRTPVPLGCIAIKREFSENWKKQVESMIRKSLQLAWENPNVPMQYILEHSQNKDKKVVKAHIELYVNEFTLDLGEEGKNAIFELTQRCKTMPLLEEGKSIL